MSTLLLGFTIDDLTFAVLCMPLFAGLVNAGIALVSAHAKKPKATPVVAILGVGAPLFSLIIIGLMIFMTGAAPENPIIGPYFDWLRMDVVAFDIAFWLDPLAFVLGIIVTFIAMELVLFALGDKEEAAYYCSGLNLGLFFCLVTLWAESLPVFFFGWESVALLTFILLYHESSHRPSALGGQPVFWLTRTGAVLFLIGIISLIPLLSSVGTEDIGLTLNIASLADYVSEIQPFQLFFFLIPVLIFVAMLPFSFWLWRAGDGKAMGLALIIGLGMPFLGIYLLARIYFLPLASQTILFIMEILGAATAFISSLLACYQNSLRRVVAFSVVSQSGLVLTAFGIASFPVGIEHWVISTFSMILLLMVTTLIMRAVGQDHLSLLGGYRKELRLCFYMSLLAGVSLVGLFPFAGFVSRSEIIWNLFNQERYFSWILIMGTCLLTAIYISRLIALAFLGQRPEAYQAPIERYWTLREGLPIFLLALLLIVAIGAVLPEGLYGKAFLRQWLQPVFEDILPIRSEIYGARAEFIFDLALQAGLIISSGVTFLIMMKRSAAAVNKSPRYSFVERLAQNDLYLSFLFQMILVRPCQIIGDYILDRFVVEKFQQGLFVDSVAAGLRLSGRGLLKLQTGFMQHYLFWIVLGAAALVVWIIL